jgi:hypothetical protein
LDTSYKRPEKYMEEALRPVLEFRKFYSVLRAAIKGAKGIGRLDHPHQRSDSAQDYGEDAIL